MAKKKKQTAMYYNKEDHKTFEKAISLDEDKIVPEKKRLKIRRTMRLESFIFGSKPEIKEKIREIMSCLDNMDMKNSFSWWCNGVALPTDSFTDEDVLEIEGFFIKYGFPAKTIDRTIKVFR